MSATLTDLPPWSNRRLFWTAALIFAAHLLMIGFLSERAEIRSRPPPALTRLRLVSPATLDQPADELIALMDPTLFALIHPHGFSGTAWLNAPTFYYEMTNRTETPRWLAPDAERLGADFTRFVQTNLLGTFEIVENPRVLHFQPQINHAPFVAQTSLRIEGDLAGRRLISRDALPVAEADTFPSNCVVQVVVNSAGDMISAIPWSGSGSPKLDKEALNFATAARFEPLRRVAAANAPSASQVTFGNLIFEWLAPALVRTNVPTAQR